MPARRDIESILILGAGPIVIGQACEFDYSGTQACRALRAEGYRIILANSNPATIMTDRNLADATYLEPLTADYLQFIVKREKPDALLPTMGGQTALNLAMELHNSGVLAATGTEVIGARPEAIAKAEDRSLFRQAMDNIGLKSPPAMRVRNMEEAHTALEAIGLPCIIRPSFTLGGAGGGQARDARRFEQLVQGGLEASPVGEVQIDRSLVGWKEFELEVVRDGNDNCIIVCSIENLDPMGVHTGDSITVAPAMTLTDREYQRMRTAAIAVLREIGVDTGGSNVQFTVNPATGEQLVVEMNPRVSRSSALASKATGFPIAKVAALLAVGYSLDELRNDSTGGVIPFSFEPALDYVVTKIPRFDFEKFPNADAHLTTHMKSIGEVMALGSSFQASLHKAMRSLEKGVFGLEEPDALTGLPRRQALERIEAELVVPGEDRLWYLAAGMRRGMSAEQLNRLSGIDPWFLHQIADLVAEEQALDGVELAQLEDATLLRLKRKGFADAHLARLLGSSELEVRRRRHRQNIRPTYRRVDTCAAEFAAQTAYLYSTYDSQCEARPSDRRKIAVLGSGPNRIGQGIEFDYCCVHAAQTLRQAGIETIMINCNPETVSTDYDISDKLYFEPLTAEDVLEVAQRERIEGVIVQFGGQTPLKLTHALANEGVRTLGTPPAAIDRAEDREEFRDIIRKLGILQPYNDIATSTEDGLQKAERIGYPLIVRPSYVLGGRGMEIVYNAAELRQYIGAALKASAGQGVLLDRFLDSATEVDVEVISDGEQVCIAGILEHVEHAGVHSGDSACSLPARSLTDRQIQQLKVQSRLLADELAVVGLMNIQYALTKKSIFVLEANPRASRTIPFVSKCIGLSLPAIATRCILGQSLRQQQVPLDPECKGYAVKEAVFPFNRFPSVDPTLGPEMRSTGEVIGLGQSYPEAYLKAQLAAFGKLPPLSKDSSAFISVRPEDRQEACRLAAKLAALGFSLHATEGTGAVLQQAGLSVGIVKKVTQGSPHAVELIESGTVSLVINTSQGRQSILDSASIRQAALRQGIYTTTTITGAARLCEVLQWQGGIRAQSLQQLHSST